MSSQGPTGKSQASQAEPVVISAHQSSDRVVVPFVPAYEASATSSKSSFSLGSSPDQPKRKRTIGI